MTTTQPESVSIGELSRLSGLTVHTLRAWENRYGRPQPIRLASGHRRYSQEECFFIRLAAMAVASGVRPSSALDMSLDQLKSITAEQGSLEGQAERDLLQDVMTRYDGPALASWLDDRLHTMTDIEFLDDMLGPAITFVGEAWKEQIIHIRHEHWFSACVISWLDHPNRYPETTREAGPPFVIASLQGERHELGLKMCSFFLRRLGIPVRYLGADTPAYEIASAVIDTKAKAVLLSVAPGNATRPMLNELKELHRLIDETTPLIVGGRGLSRKRRYPGNIVAISSFKELTGWLEDSAQTP